MYFRARVFAIAALLVFCASLFCTNTAAAFTVSKPNASNNLGLVGWWTFDGVDTIGGLVRDKSGVGNNGSASNIATSTFFMRGKIGQAVRFDGSDDRISVGDMTTLEGSAYATWAFWINPQSLVNGAPYFAKWNSGNSQQQFRIMYSSTLCGSTSDIAIQLDAGVACLAGNLTPIGKWTHVAFVYDGTQSTNATKMLIYIDGVVKSVNYISTLSSSLAATASNVTLGAHSDAAGAFSAPRLDDVRIYNRALSAAEVLALYKHGDGIKQGGVASSGVKFGDGLLAYYTFDGVDTVGGLIRDVSGNARHASSSGAATSTFYRKGRLGQALSFDGVGTVARTGTDYIGANAVTVTAWIYPRSFGEQTLGQIIGNGKFFVRMRGPTNGIYASSDGGSTLANAATGAFAQFNQWYFITVTRDASGLVNFYKNGALTGTANQSSGTPVTGTEAVNIGNVYSQAFTFDGSIDDVRVYDHILSTTEISQLYNMASSTYATTPRDNADTGNGLVGHWTFDGKDMPQGLVRDISGNGNHGSQLNMATSTAYVRGRLGQALQFDGVNDAVRMGNVYDALPQFTLATWFKSTSSSQINKGIVGKWGTTGYMLWIDSVISPGRLSLPIDASPHLVGTTDIRDGKWYHLAGTYDGVTAKVFVNGVEEGSQAESVPSSSGVTFELGRYNNGTGNLRGILDDVRIYNRALSAAEILQLYNQGR